MERDLPPTVNECIHVLVERSAAAAPDAPAVASWDGEFSYAELNRHANQLARVLAEMGFSRKNLILICFEKSSCAAVAMLGILKAGAGFVPLDPALPPERISAIIAQTGSSLALVSASTSKRIVNLVSRTLVVWVASNMWLGSDDMVIGSASPRNIAYTIFTSGSTGVAKGVVIEHSAVSTSVIYRGREI
jgi:non-ribosomal peptide synthetase component F